MLGKFIFKKDDTEGDVTVIKHPIDVNKAEEETVEDDNKTDVKLSAPWYTYYHMIDALFGKDPDITIEFDDEAYVLKIFVNSSEKADAIAKLLPTEKVFGNITLKIDVIPADKEEDSKMSLLQKAFKGNPIFSFAISIKALYNNPINYFVFKHDLVQFFNDDLSDPNGLCTTLHQDIAEEVFSDVEFDQIVNFCTDKPGNPGPISFDKEEEDE